MTTGGSSVLSALLLDGIPGPEAEAALWTFGQFVGRWRLEWTGFNPGRAPDRAVGELAFDWVLGGRALQDVWMVPGRDQVGTGDAPRGFYGTTVRMFDPAIGAWRSTWINTTTHRVRRFIGTSVPEGITLLSTEETPWLRWCFRKITRESFVWTGDYSADGGVTWHADDQMIATRLHE